MICSAGPLYEAEGMREVDVVLRRMFPDESRRPAVLYYDLACRYRDYIRTRHPLFWRGTLLAVDR